MWTILSNTRHIHSHKLVITTFTLVWTILLGVVCATSHLVFVTVASMWTTLPEVAHVLLCCVSLTELGLFPFNLRLTLTLSLYSERTLTQATLSTHQACEPHCLKTK